MTFGILYLVLPPSVEAKMDCSFLAFTMWFSLTIIRGISICIPTFLMIGLVQNTTITHSVPRPRTEYLNYLPYVKIEDLSKVATTVQPKVVLCLYKGNHYQVV